MEEPIPIVDDAIRDITVEIAADFGAAFRSFAMDKHGWKYDSTSDLPRLGRLPGTFNVKGETPLPVTWRSDPMSRRYSIDEILQEIARWSVSQTKPRRSAPIATTGVVPALPDVLAKALRDADGKWWIGQITEQAVGPNPASMVAGCRFLQYAAENAAALSEPGWFNTLRLLAGTENGEAVAHAVSAPHPDYDHAATQQKFDHAKDDYESDLTCDYIALDFEGCSTCPFRHKLHSPVHLGNRSKDHAELLVNTAYIERTDEFVDLNRVSKAGVKAEQFSRYHDGKRLFGSASKVITSDPIAIKAHERAYRPDMGPGTFEEDDTLYLNYYRAPIHAPSSKLPRWLYRHLRYLVPDRAERKVVIRWLAHLVQHPAVKLGYALALIGGQGTGKSWLLNLMTKVLGADNVRVSGGRSVLSQFNGQFAGRVLLGLEEVTITGRAEAYEGLKALITNETDEFTRKHVNPEILQTPRGVLVLSNDAYALHLPPDDRRFFVVQTPAQKHPGGSDYYTKLFALDDAFVASVYASLKRVNLDGFAPKIPPFETSAKQKMVGYSRADVDVTIEELVQQHRGPFAYALATWDDIRHYVRDHVADKTLTDKRIKRALEQVGVVIDPQGRQCRLKRGQRVIFYMVRCADDLAKLKPTELTERYEADAPRFDADDEQLTPGRRSHAEQAYIRRCP